MAGEQPDMEQILIEPQDLMNKSVTRVAELLDTSVNDGLTDAVAAERLNIHGYNKLEVPVKDSRVYKFFAFMWNPFSWAIEVGAILAFAVAIIGNQPQGWPLFLGIAAMLIMRSTVNLVAERYEQSLMQSTMAGLARKVKVLRQQSWIHVDASVLVPGDIISVKLGDIIPADIRLLREDTIQIDQYALTGDCTAIEMKYGDCVFSESTCIKGQSQGLVIATGNRTFFGKPAHIQDTKSVVGHSEKVTSTTTYFCICLVVVALLIEVLVMYVFQKRPYQSINNLLVIIIGGIPVAMPMVLSLSKAITFRRLSKQGALAKRMAAIENLAKMNVLCTNKTGVLTLDTLQVSRNHIKVMDTNANNVLLMAARASSTENKDAIESAIDGALGVQFDRKRLRDDVEEIDFEPVTDTNRCSTFTYNDRSLDGHPMIRVTKGDPEQILTLIQDQTIVERVRATVTEFTQRGEMAVAVAQQVNTDMEGAGGAWTILGLLPLFEPAQVGNVHQIAMAGNFGIKVKLITGEPLTTAKNTAECLQIGSNIYSSSSILNHQKESITLLTVDDLIERADGFAELVPEDKCLIVKRLKMKKHTCGMTGHGVGDTRALKEANVGIAIVDASAAACSAADVVLTKPGISAIIEAARASRAFFLNLKNYTIYTISMTVHIMLGFMLLALVWRVDFPPFMLLVIAFLNQGSVIFGIAKDKPEPLSRHSWKLRDMFVTGILFGGYLAVMTILFFWVAIKTDFFSRSLKLSSLQSTSSINLQKAASAMYLQVSIISEVLLFVTRSYRWSFIDRPSKLFAAAIFGSQLIATLIAVYANWSFAGINGIGWGWAGVIWLYNLVTYMTLDAIKIFIRYALAKLASRLEWVDSQRVLQGSGRPN
ncbi:hypothetical protein MKW94_008775, partial [Papaver nudicaule]|nr:hypothetical protein [Papaver nudicaule]